MEDQKNNNNDTFLRKYAPEEIIANEATKMREMLDAIHANLTSLDFSKLTPEKGDKGDVGPSPVKGQDYFTEQEIGDIAEAIRSFVKDGQDGVTPVKGEDYFTEDEVQEIKDAITGDISNTIPKQIIEYINATPNSIAYSAISDLDSYLDAKFESLNDPTKTKFQLDYSRIKNAPQMKFDPNGGPYYQVAGAGSSGGGSGTVTSVATGTGLTGGPITTTGTISLATNIAPIATLGSAGQLIRVNAGGTALEYFTASAGGVTSVVGTTNRITVDSTDPANPIVDIAATYVGQTSITTLGTIGTGTWQGTSISTTYTDAKIKTVTGTSNRITIGGTSTDPTFDISSSYIGQSSITTLGTIVTGVWNGTTIGATYGGTGIDSSASTGIAQVASGTWSVSTALANGTTATTQSAGDNSTKVATTAYVNSATAAQALIIGTTTISSGANTRILYDNSGVLGEYTISGSGTVVAMATAPTIGTSLTASYATASTIAIFDASKNLISADTATYPSLTELSYVKGVTSSIQTQLNAKGTGTVTSVGASFTGGLISVSGSPVTTTGTLALTVAGTSGGIPYFSSTSAWASSALLAANALMIGGGSGAAPSTTTTGTGVITALGVNVGSAGAFVTFNGALGTPSSGTVTNLTGTASININGTVGATTPTTGAFTTVTTSGQNVLSANSTDKYVIPTSDGATGPTTASFNSGFSSTAVGDLVYLDSSATWQAADADSSATTYSSMLGIALSATASGAAATVALPGSFVRLSTWSWTVGGKIYMSTTAKGLTQTAPTATDSATIIVGWAVATDKIYFMPYTNYLVHA